MESGNKPSFFRRRTFIVDRDFQYRYMTTWGLITVGFVAVNALVLYWGACVVKHQAASEMVLGHLAFLLKSGAYFVIAVAAFLCCLLLLLSHRIAGPAYRLKKSLDRMAGGDYGFEVRLRKRDYLKDVAESMNQTLDRLRRRRERTEALRERLRKAAAAAAIDGALAAEIEATFDDILRVDPPQDDATRQLPPVAGVHA
jgi:methyl-accepting chemotaxis protein